MVGKATAAGSGRSGTAACTAYSLPQDLRLGWRELAGGGGAFGIGDHAVEQRWPLLAQQDQVGLGIIGGGDARAGGHQPTGEQNQTDRRRVVAALAAGDLDDWNRAAAEVIAAWNGLELDVAPRQRTGGAAKDRRFFRFREELSPDALGSAVLLKLKTGNARSAGRISLEVPHGGTDAEASGARAAGFDVDRSARGPSLIVSSSGPQLAGLTIQRAAKEQVAALHAAADHAQRLIEWWEQLQARRR